MCNRIVVSSVVGEWVKKQKKKKKVEGEETNVRSYQSGTGEKDERAVPWYCGPPVAGHSAASSSTFLPPLDASLKITRRIQNTHLIPTFPSSFCPSGSETHLSLKMYPESYLYPQSRPLCKPSFLHMCMIILISLSLRLILFSFLSWGLLLFSFFLIYFLWNWAL